MKRCPTCYRTYSDETLTFCLADGSLLSAPYDTEAGLHHSDSAPTEVMPRHVSMDGVAPTLVAEPEKSSPATAKSLFGWETKSDNRRSPFLNHEQLQDTDRREPLIERGARAQRALLNILMRVLVACAGATVGYAVY